MGDPHAKDGVINGAAEARKAVRQRYKEGADLIKITATGGVLSTAKSGQNPQFMDDELEAIMQTANDYGFKVAAHAHGAEGMKRAIKAGINSIEHGTLMDDETRKLMKKNAADLLDESDNLGSLTVGKYADIVAVKGNPLENIQLLERVDFVMKGGSVIKTQ